MIRTYSDPLIAIEVVTTEEKGTPVTIVTAEDVRPKQDVTIYFYGRMAAKASAGIVAGIRFTFRGGIVNNKVVGRTFAPIA